MEQDKNDVKYIRSWDTYFERDTYTEWHGERYMYTSGINVVSFGIIKFGQPIVTRYSK